MESLRFFHTTRTVTVAASISTALSRNCTSGVFVVFRAVCTVSTTLSRYCTYFCVISIPNLLGGSLLHLLDQTLRLDCLFQHPSHWPQSPLMYSFTRDQLLLQHDCHFSSSDWDVSKRTLWVDVKARLGKDLSLKSFFGSRESFAQIAARPLPLCRYGQGGRQQPSS